MIETKCSCCGGKVILPDPPARTMDERFAFERAWDRQFMEGLKPHESAKS